MNRRAKAVILVAVVASILVALGYGLTQSEQFQKYLGFDGLDQNTSSQLQASGQSEPNSPPQGTTSVSNLELNDLSCQNLKTRIEELLPEMDRRVIRSTTGNQTASWFTYETRSAEPYATVLQVYLELYQINGCPDRFEYPMQRTVNITGTLSPENFQVTSAYVRSGTAYLTVRNTGTATLSVDRIFQNGVPLNVNATWVTSGAPSSQTTYSGVVSIDGSGNPLHIVTIAQGDGGTLEFPISGTPGQSLQITLHIQSGEYYPKVVVVP